MNKEIKDLLEQLHAVVLDTVYIQMKENFVDYENKTHKLGIFKEEVKRKFSEVLKQNIN